MPATDTRWPSEGGMAGALLPAAASVTHTRHVRALDGLRGYAAVLVVFFHAILHVDESLIHRVMVPPFKAVSAQEMPVKLALTLFDGTSAVVLFFVLSGAVLCASLLHEPLTLRESALFLARRVLRLLPALLLCMLLMYLAALAHRGWAPGYPQVSLDQAVANALLLDIRVHGPSGSIQTEALAAPFVLLFVLVFQRFALPGALVFGALAVIAIDEPALVFGWPNLHACIGAFTAGMLVVLPPVAPLWRRASTAALCAMLAGGFLARHVVSLNAPAGLFAQLLLFAACVGYLWHAAQANAFQRLLEHPVSQLLGRISYSYYLLNVPLLFLFWFSPPLAWFADIKSPLVGGLLIGTLVALLTVPLAWLSWRWVEVPFIRFGTRLSRRAEETKVAHA